MQASVLGVIDIDHDLHVQVWNAHSKDLWGLRAAEVHGSNLLDLDIGLPVKAPGGTDAPVPVGLDSSTRRRPRRTRPQGSRLSLATCGLDR